MGIRPPGVAASWDDCNVWDKSMLIAYSQIRDYEEMEEKIEFAKVGRL